MLNSAYGFKYENLTSFHLLFSCYVYITLSSPHTWHRLRELVDGLPKFWGFQPEPLKS